MEARPNTGSAERELQILDHAMAVFMRYGYSRSTMDDIARECGISRPALYQFFRNKADIYRAIAKGLLDASLNTMGSALQQSGPLKARLVEAIDKSIFEGMEALEQSNHGAEMLDMKNELSADIVDAFHAGMVDALAKAYGTEPGSEKVGAAELALQLSDYLEGLKARVPGRPARVAALSRFVDLQLSGLRRLAGDLDSPTA